VYFHGTTHITPLHIATAYSFGIHIKVTKIPGVKIKNAKDVRGKTSGIVRLSAKETTARPHRFVRPHHRTLDAFSRGSKGSFINRSTNRLDSR